MNLLRTFVQKSYSAKRLVRRLWRTRQTAGAAAAVAETRRVLRELLAPAKAGPEPTSDFDVANGVDTAGIVRIADMEIAGPNYRFGVFYKASSPEPFRAVLDRLNLDWRRFQFVDMGSGKGLVLLLASHYAFKRITGVEFGANLHRIAEANVVRYRPKERLCQDVVSVCQDAGQYRFAAEPLVVYFYEPFEAPVLQAVLRNLEDSYQSHPRPIILIYHNAPSTSTLAEEAKRRVSLFTGSSFPADAGFGDPLHTLYVSAEAGKLLRQKQFQ